MSSRAHVSSLFYRSLALLLVALPCFGLGGAADPAVDEAPRDEAAELLAAAAEHSTQAKQWIESVMTEPPSEELGKLAAVLIKEWGLDAADPGFTYPRVVWYPHPHPSDVPFEQRKSQIPRIVVQGTVGANGRFEAPELARSTGSETIDNLILEAASRALFRPARRAGRYVEGTAMIVFHWSV